MMESARMLRQKSPISFDERTVAEIVDDLEDLPRPEIIGEAAHAEVAPISGGRTGTSFAWPCTRSGDRCDRTRPVGSDVAAVGAVSARRQYRRRCRPSLWFPPLGGPGCLAARAGQRSGRADRRGRSHQCVGNQCDSAPARAGTYNLAEFGTSNAVPLD